MFVYRFAAAAALIAIPVTSHASIENVKCWSSEEIPAAHITNLQTFLMIESLKCRNTIPATFESYDKFIDSKRETLVSHRHQVEAHFLRQYGTYDG